MTWYKTGSMYTPEIREVEVERFTDKYVWVAGRRYGRKTQYDCVFPTFEEAVDYYREVLGQKLESAKDEVKQAERRIAQLERGVLDRSIIYRPKPRPEKLVL